jgi:hypothetical protein
MAQSERVWRWLTLACALCTVLPLFAARYLPFSDLPEHVATVATLRHWFDPAWHEQALYEFQGFKTPYLAYHVLGVALAFVTGDALSAVRILLAASGFALPYATRSLASAFGGDRRVALLACPLFWCRPLVVGFAPYMAAVPMALYAIALVVRQTEQPRAPRALGLLLLSVALFYVHLDAFVLLVVTAAALTLCPPGPCCESVGRRLLALPRRLWWLAGGGLAAVGWALRADADAGPSLLEGSEVVHVPLRQLSKEFAAWTHDIWKSHVDEATGVAFWGLVLLLAWQHREPEPHGVRGVVARWMPFASALALFVLLPFRVGTGAMINVRLAVFLGLFALVVVRPDRRRLTSAVFAAGAVLALVVAANAAFEIHGAQRDELAGFDALLGEMDPGAKLIALEFDRSSRYTDLAPWIHVGAYHRLRRGGVASFSFADLPHWPLRYRAEARPPDHRTRFMEWKPCLFRNSIDGPYYDFVLARGALDPFANDPPGPRWRAVGRALDWTLYARSATEVPPQAGRQPEGHTRPEPSPSGAPDEGPCAKRQAVVAR